MGIIVSSELSPAPTALTRRVCEDVGALNSAQRENDRHLHTSDYGIEEIPAPPWVLRNVKRQGIHQSM